MRLLYFWVNDFQCLKNAEMNFTDFCRFKFDYKSKSLTVAKFDSIALFDGNTVSDLSVLVGSNGSGKTTVAELIYDIFYLGNPDKKEFIFILEIEDHLVIKYELGTYKIKNNTNLNIDIFKDTDNFYTIYFSSIYYLYSTTEKALSNWWTTFYDISTSTLLRSDKETLENENGSIEYKKEININHIDANTILDNRRCINFISEYFDKGKNNLNLESVIPEKVVFSSNINEISLFKNEFPSSSDFYNRFSTIEKKVIPSLANQNNKEVFKINNFLVLFCNFIRAYCGKNEEVDREYLARIDSVLQSNQEDDPILFLKSIFQALNKRINVNINNEHTTNILKYIETILHLPDSLFINNSIIFNLKDEKEKKLFLTFNENYVLAKSLTEVGITRFYPRPSAGELSEILIYARLYEQIKAATEDAKSKLNQNNYVIFLDEVETTLHPLNQQKFIRNLLTFFNTYFTNIHIHIIIATHSPIILSDVPTSNSIFLEKNEKTNEILIVPDKHKENTFGANIYQLYENSFFLKESFIGAYADAKINQVLTKLNNKETLEKQEIDYIEALAKIIGEPVLKNYILRELRK